MKKFQKILALVLACVMVFSLAACEKKPAENKDPQTEVNNGSEEKTYDFKGVTVKAIGNEWNNLDNTENPKYAEAKAYVEKKYNIKLEKGVLEGANGRNEAELLIASINAGDPAAHIINLNSQIMVPCFTNDILLDITDYLDELQVGSAYTDVASWKGRCYGVAYENIGDTWVLVYDRDKLKEIGMEKTPTDLFMEGKWDYESCKAYLADMKSKLAEDEYPIACYPTHWGWMAASANGVQICDGNGNINFTDEAVIEALTFYQELEEAGLAFPAWATYSEEEDDYTDGDIRYAVNDPSIIIKRAETWQLSGLDFNFGVVYWPWGSNVTCTGDYTTLSDNYNTAGCYWGFDAIVKDAVKVTGIPGNVLALIDQDYRNAVADDHFEWMHDAYVAEKKGTYSNEGPEAGEPRSFRTEQDIELFDWGHTRYKADFSWAFDAGKLTETEFMFYRIFLEYKDVRSMAESFENSSKAKLKEAGVIE